MSSLKNDVVKDLVKELSKYEKLKSLDKAKSKELKRTLTKVYKLAESNSHKARSLREKVGFDTLKQASQFAILTLEEEPDGISPQKAMQIARIILEVLCYFFC